jgi:hypothetical protein
MQVHSINIYAFTIQFHGCGLKPPGGVDYTQ